LDFVKENFEEYCGFTSRPNNWAGTSEVIALAQVLGKRLVAFGDDKVIFHGKKQIPVDERTGLVRPYFVAEPVLPASDEEADEPIVLFQAWGGGHYQVLLPKSRGEQSDAAGLCEI